MLATGEVHARELQAVPAPAPAPVEQPTESARPTPAATPDGQPAIDTSPAPAPVVPAQQQPAEAPPVDLPVQNPAPAPRIEVSAPAAAPLPANDEQGPTVKARRVRTPHAKGDPFERWNRKLFAFHQRADHALFRPLALFYKHVIPKPLRTALRHILSNMTEPLVFMNDVLQLKPKRAARTFSRFIINSTVGVGGVFDVAKTAALPHRDNSLGDTLAFYGVGPGPYIFIPFFGPTYLRDLLTGQAENILYPVAIGEPFDRMDYQLSSGLVQGLDLRAESDADFKALLDGAADPYATLRSVYQQSRQAEIAEIKGKRTQVIDFEDPLTDPDAPKATPPAGAPPASGTETPPPANDQTATPAPADQPAPPPAANDNAAPATQPVVPNPAPAPVATPSPVPAPAEPAPRQLELHTL